LRTRTEGQTTIQNGGTGIAKRHQNGKERRVLKFQSNIHKITLVSRVLIFGQLLDTFWTNQKTGNSSLERLPCSLGSLDCESWLEELRLEELRIEELRTLCNEPSEDCFRLS
jgi:hypothetical protein